MLFLLLTIVESTFTYNPQLKDPGESGPRHNATTLASCFPSRSFSIGGACPRLAFERPLETPVNEPLTSVLHGFAAARISLSDPPLAESAIVKPSRSCRRAC